MTQNFISNVSMQFEYFDLQLNHPDWADKKVLDFGGNVGNILLDPNCKIQESNYWCLDVSRSAIREGQKRYPDATFTFYDSYNISFNPDGIVDLPIPDLGERFDYILAYSIFSHMDESEMREKVTQLSGMLADEGIFIFTFLVSDYNAADHHSGYLNMTNFEKRLSRLNGGVINEKMIEKSRDAQSMVLVNAHDLFTNGETYYLQPHKEGDTFFTYFTSDYLKEIFDCEIKNPPSKPYYRNYPAEMQHSCLIKKNRN